MAEEESELELDRFKKELESLINTSASDERGLQSKLYCARFCELVEEQTGRWQVPLPQLQVLRSALCTFVHGATSFPSDCEHVRYTLSSIALSVFELLLFFGKDEFPEDPLKEILDSFQECHSSLVRYQNVYLLQVRQIIRDGGPWASPVLQGILKESEQAQEEVERYLSSELSIFFELRVRYLLACEQTREAMVLAQRCSQHLTAGRHLFFKQAYLTCLCKASEQERLLKEMAEIDGKDAVEILCMVEKEEKEELLLGLSRSFLLQQLMSGDMCYLWHLVFIWCKLYLRMNTPREEFLEECKQMILSATNIKAIFPFIKVILAEQLEQDGLTFCLELCARALQTDLKNEPVTKSLIYKIIAYLLPNDLEVCRACALLVFFLERTVEAYKTVFLLYNHPDQEYHLDTSPIGNHVRFELIQILKKGLYFDPEFWSLLNIRTNCLKLMSEKVAKAALCEIMEEDKWVPSCCVRGQCKCRVEPERTIKEQVAKPTNKQESEVVDKQVRPLSEDTTSKIPLPKKRGRKPGSKVVKDPEPCPVRRSFRQLDLAQNHARQLSNRHQRFLTRQAEKKTHKRRGRKPRWLLEELAAQAENSAPRQGKKPGRKPKQLNVKGISVQTPVIEITMEISYPDNEVDLPSDVQGWPVCKMTLTTESNFKESKSPCQGPPAQPHTEASNSLLQLLSEESTSSWRDEEKDTEEFAFWLHDDLAFIRKFHTYAKVPEVEGILNDALTDNLVTMPVLAVEQESPLLTPTSENDPCEPVNTVTQVEIESTFLTTALTLEVSAPVEGTVDTHEGSSLEMHPGPELLLVSPVEDSLLADGMVSVLENSTVDFLQDETINLVADTVLSPENTQEIAVFTPDIIPDKATDICTSESGSEKSTDHDSVHEHALETTVNTTPVPEIALQITADNMSTLEKITDSHEHAPVAPKEVRPVSENASVMASEHKIPASLAEEKPQEPEEDQNELPWDMRAVTNSSAPVSGSQTVVRLLHCCGLCGKECKSSSVLRHAFWHYRIERKCMFCHCFNYAHGPLCHFKKHIKDLKEGLTTLSEKPDQIVPRALPKKMRPGLAQIKSRLLMKLNVRRETSPQHKVENNLDANGRSLKQNFKKIGATGELEEGKEMEEKNEDDQGRIPKTKVRYFTRGLVRKSESKGKFLRARLARKAKTEGDVSGTQDSNVHRANGVLRKRRNMKHVQEESCQSNGEKNVPSITKQEKDDQETVVGSEAEQVKADSTSKERKSLNWTTPEEKEMLEKTRIRKKKNRLADQKEDDESAKRRKVDSGQNERSGVDQKQKESAVTLNLTDGTQQENVAAGVTNAINQENGTELDEASKPVQKKKLCGTPPMVKCPVEACTFQTRPSPVLSHVLIHHPGDTKALEFFYNLAKEKCLFCGRRIWSPQHFFDHVVSHRGNLKHPCYHVDCKERFKTRLALGDHMLKDHHPLRAVCCFPGCAGQFANSKLLYSHERVHYKLVRKKALPKKNKSVTSSFKKCEKVVEMNLTASNANPSEMQQTLEGITAAPSQTQPAEGAQQTKSATPVKLEDEKPLMLNRSSVSYANKSPRLVNGHSKHGREARVKPPAAVASKEQLMEYGKMSNKPFVRPPPSAYLDESYISMPKRWKGPQLSPKGSTVSIVSPTKRQCCSRCSASFDTDEELQAHREKCTSLFGFDSDDESAS
ncbi:uncharacterized protein znf654 isoform X1 [Electrophorus electricus]|uniref:uncharacterized protein znf654 isoform X1 n=1 Tax=Electrophorus electricus TaxID=8005 RepID=UPI0015CFF301|nr:uncharacterized protein znf654 isoform X1 [Electrophorus electricus]